MAISKNDSTRKSTNSSPSTLHPPYFQMISEAITKMKDRTGSSQPAIAKFLEGNYGKMLPSNFRKVLSIQLKRFVESEKLVKVKNSYKISAANDKTKSNSDLSKKKTSTTQSKNPSNRVNAAKPSDSRKPKKTKRLSQVKTPEALKKRTMAKNMVSGSAKGMKKKRAATPMKRNAAKKAKS